MRKKDRLAVSQRPSETFATLPWSRTSLSRVCEYLHPHDLDATLSQLGELVEPVLHIGHRVVGFEIRLIGEYLIENEMARRFAIFLKKIDQILRIASNKLD